MKSPTSATPLATQNLQQHLQQRVGASSSAGGMEAATSSGAAVTAVTGAVAGEFAEERKDGDVQVPPSSRHAVRKNATHAVRTAAAPLKCFSASREARPPRR